MKKIVLIIISFCMVIFTSCSSPKENYKKDKKPIVICEASTYPMVLALVDNYNANSNNNIQVKLVDNISNLKEQQKKEAIIISYEDQNLEKVNKEPLGLEGMAIVVNGNNNINDISLQDLSNIYLGKINNWKKLNGEDGSIDILIFKGTEKFLKKQKDNTINFNISDNKNNTMQYVNDTNSFNKIVNSNKNILAFIPRMNLDKGLKYIDLNNIKLNENNIKNGLYKLNIPVNMYYTKNNQQSLSEFIRYVKSDNGKKIIKNYCTDENS